MRSISIKDYYSLPPKKGPHEADRFDDFQPSLSTLENR